MHDGSPRGICEELAGRLFDQLRVRLTARHPRGRFLTKEGSLELMIAGSVLQKLVEGGHVIERGPRVDQDDALFGIELELWSQLERGGAVLGHVHKMESCGRKGQRDTLTGLAAAAVEQ